MLPMLTYNILLLFFVLGMDNIWLIDTHLEKIASNDQDNLMSHTDYVTYFKNIVSPSLSNILTMSECFSLAQRKTFPRLEAGGPVENESSMLYLYRE